jgi:hypothetical protein
VNRGTNTNVLKKCKDQCQAKKSAGTNAKI